MQQLDIGFQRKGCPATKLYSVRWVYNSQIKQLRPINFLAFVKAELKIEAFGQEYLALQLAANVKFFFLMIFIDGFGLYQNIYCSLTGVYAMPAALSTTDYQKSSNAHTLTLSLYRSDFNMILSCF